MIRPMSVGASDRAQKYAAFLEQFGVPYADEIAQLVAKHTVDYHGDIREVLNWIVDNVDRSLNKGEILRQVEDYLNKLNGSSLKLEMDNLDQLYYEKSYYENLLSELEYMDLTPEEREAMEKEIKNQLAHIKAKIIKLEEKRRQKLEKRRVTRKRTKKPKPRVEPKAGEAKEEPKPIEEEVIELELTPIREIELPNVEVSRQDKPEKTREEHKPKAEPKPRVEEEPEVEPRVEPEPKPKPKHEPKVEPRPEIELKPRIEPKAVEETKEPTVDISDILKPLRPARVSLEPWLTHGVETPKPRPRPKARVLTDKLFLDEGLGVRVWLRDDGIAFVYCEDPRVKAEPYVERRRGKWVLRRVRIRVSSHTHGPITLWVGR